MATVLVDFSGAWLTDPATPEVSLSATFPDRKASMALTGQVRIYAGGRRRVITSRGDTRTYPLVLQILTDVQCDLLTSWRGRVLLLRDQAGRRVWGTFLQIDTEDFDDPDGTLHDATITFAELDYVEAVG